MELVDGPTLRDVLREEGPLPAGRALELTRVVLGGLGHSHAAGIVHRDIKPSNIMLTPKGEAKVMDFGIARAAAETTSDLTGTATVIGTAALPVARAGPRRAGRPAQRPLLDRAACSTSCCWAGRRSWATPRSAWPTSTYARCRCRRARWTRR